MKSLFDEDDKVEVSEKSLSLLDDLFGSDEEEWDEDHALSEVMNSMLDDLSEEDVKTIIEANENPAEPNDKLMQLGGEDKELETFEKDENFILPNRNQFYIQLYTPNGWEQLPLGKYVLGEWEHVTSLKLVSLPYEGHSSGFRSYLAASTINCYNEDVNSRGRVLIFDVIEVEPEPDKPLTSIKMKTILEKEQKGPVTCLESVNGYLLGGVGQKVYVNFID